MPQDTRPATESLAELLLNQPLDAWVNVYRDGPKPLAWDRIATHLAAATEQRIDVTGETLRRWYSDTQLQLDELEQS